MIESTLKETRSAVVLCYLLSHGQETELYFALTSQMIPIIFRPFYVADLQNCWPSALIQGCYVNRLLKRSRNEALCSGVASEREKKFIDD